MIQVSNLTKSYGSQVLFREVSFNINSGERVGLVGRNGHGKTTLLRLILKREEPDSGSISVPKNYRIGYLEQHLDFTQPTILDEVCTCLPVSHEHDAWRAEKILSGLGFDEPDMQRPPFEFSGGFQVRLNLAKVLVSEPDLLLLDEPTNYLDIVSIRWLRRFLQEWKGEFVLITHDRSFMDSVTTHTLGIHRKKIRKIEGDTEKLYDQIAQDEEIYEKTRQNEEKRRQEVEQFIRRFRAKARLANLVQSRVKTLEKQGRKEKLEKIETLDFSFNSAPFPSKVMLEAEDLSFSYHSNGVNLFEALGVTIARDDRICIVGKNGKGKTTLIKILAGKLPPRTGYIRTHPSLQRNYFEQTNIADLDPNRSIEAELMATSPDCTKQTARNIAGAMMFGGDEALKKISVLSGGEKSRVMLGKLLITPCQMLLLDEPTNHLDMEASDSLLAALDDFDGAVVLVTHDEMFLDTLANRLIVFDRGRTFLYEGSYQNFLKDVGWENDDAGSHSKNGNDRKADALDQKTLRRMKAELVQEKSRVLKPLETRIAELEQAIEASEAELSELTEQLVQASTSGDGERIAKLAKTQQDLETTLEDMYGELEDVTTEFEQRSAEYEDKMESCR